MKALTVRNPWAWAIIHAGKRIENRTRRTHFRGRFYIHAGIAVPDWRDVIGCESRVGHRIDGMQFTSGALIGTAELVDCVYSDRLVAPWGESYAWHWILDNVRPLKRPIPARGQLGLWEYRA